MPSGATPIPFFLRIYGCGCRLLGGCFFAFGDGVDRCRLVFCGLLLYRLLDIHELLNIFKGKLCFVMILCKILACWDGVFIPVSRMSTSRSSVVQFSVWRPDSAACLCPTANNPKEFDPVAVLISVRKVKSLILDGNFLSILSMMAFFRSSKLCVFVFKLTNSVFRSLDSLLCNSVFFLFRFEHPGKTATYQTSKFSRKSSVAC